MDSSAQRLCKIIRRRTAENRYALNSFDPFRGLSPAVSILRQELDSMVRVIFLLRISNPEERRRLIECTLAGQLWRVGTPNGKLRTVTDREMAQLSQELEGWTLSVYKFGCAFIHLSDFHSHFTENPLEKLPAQEKRDILSHMRYYHGGPADDNPTIEVLASYIRMVFEKIASNLECYLRDLEEGVVSAH